jgi:hypothetical protein
MDEELDQIEKNDTWELVPRPKNKNVNTSKQPRNFYFSNQVYQRNAKEVQNGILQTNYHSHANQLQVEQR